MIDFVAEHLWFFVCLSFTALASLVVFVPVQKDANLMSFVRVLGVAIVALLAMTIYLITYTLEVAREGDVRSRNYTDAACGIKKSQEN